MYRTLRQHPLQLRHAHRRLS
eukprot:COSAG02_NODE_44465_length_366_cov_0.580524_2_plen_20_part_01